MEMCSTTSIIRKMKIKSVMIYYDTFTGVTQIKTKTDSTMPIIMT